MKARNIEKVRKEVEEMRDSQGEQVDPKIKDLVIGLCRWGIKTEGSCQGHLFHGFSYPHVDVSKESLENLLYLAGHHWWVGVKEKESNWVIKPVGKFVRLMPENKGRWKLWELQKEAQEFGKWLQEIPENFFEGGS